MRPEPQAIRLESVADGAASGAALDASLGDVRRLFLAYADSLGFSLCFQGFDAELAALPGGYAPPSGVLLLARRGDGEAVGCGALRRLGEGVCEMKRLYVAPEARGLGVGRRIAEALVGEARRLGYATMRLDTVASMAEARALYASLGFVETPPYCANPQPDVRYLALTL